MTDWNLTARAIWTAILDYVQARHRDGDSLQKIADTVGVSHRAVVSSWLKGDKTAENGTFASLLTYAERCGVDWSAFFPERQGASGGGGLADKERAELVALRVETAALRQQLEKMKETVVELQVYKAKWEGYIEVESIKARSGQPLDYTTLKKLTQ